MTSETERWDQICTCVFKWNTFFFYLVRDIIQCKITKHFGISKDNVSILCLSFITMMDLFRVMLLTLLLCKMAFSCINPHKNAECYSVMLSHSKKEIALEFDGCSFFGLIIKKDKVLKHFYLYRNGFFLSNPNNMPRS